MTDREAPKLDPRRAEEFRGELLERAHAWVRGWNVGDPAGGFGAALLDVAARFSTQVAERLDRAGEKLSLGLLDWLALRGKAARPARMPVAFKLADTATEPVLAKHPVQLQTDVEGASVVFEIEADVQLVPGRLEQIVAVDAGQDQYFLPPPGLSSLDPLEPMPTQWRLKSFADAQATRLQFDPELGLVPEMLIDIGGKQHRIVAVDGDLVTIEPALDVVGGVDAGATVDKVMHFDPFGDAARSRQEHFIYLGDEDLLNIEAAAVLEIHGAGTKLSAATWEYFGKAENDDEARWRELKVVPSPSGASDALTLEKPKGAIEPTAVGKIKSGRWIRARQKTVASEHDILSTEALTVIVNPGAGNQPCPASGVAAQPGVERAAEGFTNTTPLAFAGVFYPLGREPRQFDTFYLGSADAFSKKGADVAICFELSDPSANAFAALREGLFANRVLASVGGDGALHLLAVNGTTGLLSRFLDHGPLQPQVSGSVLGLDAEPHYRPPIWAVNDDNTISNTLSGTSPFGGGLLGFLGAFFSNPFYVAAAAGKSVWVWKEYPSFKVASRWIPFGELPAPSSARQIDALVYLRDSVDVAASMLFAVCSGLLFEHSAVAARNAEPWTPVPLTGSPVSANPNDPFKLTAIAPIDNWSSGRWHGTLANGMVGVFSNNTVARVYFVSQSGQCTPVDNAVPAATGTRPAAAHIGNHVYVFWQVVNAAVTLHVAQVKQADFTAHDADLDTNPIGPSPQTIAGGLLEIPPHETIPSVLATGIAGNDSWMLSWTPFAAGQNYFQSKLPGGVGPLGGAPTALDGFLVAPGTQSDAWSTPWDSKAHKDFPVELESGVVVPTSLTPAIARHDYVAVETTGSPLKRSEVGALDHTVGAERFHSLDAEFGVGAADAQLVLYRSASGTGLPATGTSPDEMTLDSGEQDSVKDEWLLVDTGSALRFCQIKSIDKANPTWKLKFKHNPNPNLPNGPLTYWHAQRVPGRIAPFVQLDPNGNGAWDAKLLERMPLTFANRDPATQSARAFDVTAGGRPRIVVLGEAWTAAPGNGNTTCSFEAMFASWTRQLGENTTNPTLIWEYWSGRGWDELPIETDDTEDFKVTGRLRFKVPATLAPTDVNGKINHWIRARLIAGDYGHEIVTVVTKPHPSVSNATVQEVQRDASGFHPPLVVNMRIRYSVSTGLPPTYVLTQDAGSMRDQSDANRTLGASVEACVPLSVQMRRLETGALPPASADPAGADGGCHASQVKSPAAATPAPAAIASLPQSILLGFSAGLLGEPINVLLLVEERSHDDFAPLAVEALRNDRFESIAVSDTTRALGESGLLSLSFPVKPSPRDLFGSSLTWLRLRPSRLSATSTWQPVIRGAYLNAAWASATETLTRESLGSSDGRPFLMVQVARPPLLQDSLELRVREPLDDEERKQLLDENPASVKFNEPDLRGDWVLWRQVADPNDYGPRERVYALDEQTGEIQFGDGRHGMIPPIGRDSIVAFSYQRTEAAADGQSVPANKVVARSALQLVTPVESVEAAFAADNAAGGAPPEDDARVLRFGNARLRHRERAVAPSDFEDLALQSSRDIAQARAFRTAQGLRLVVVMRGPDPAPNASQRRELERLLQNATSPLLGDRDAIVIEAPKVHRLRLRLALRVASLDDAGRLGEDAKRLLMQLFDTATGGMTESGWPLGVAPSEEDVAYALGGAADLAGIDTIEMLEIDARGNEQPWPAQLRRGELVMLAEDAFRIRFEPLEVPA